MGLAMFTRHTIEDSDNIPIPHPMRSSVRACAQVRWMLNAQLSATTRRGLCLCPVAAVYKATVREQALVDGSRIAIANLECFLQPQAWK